MVVINATYIAHKDGCGWVGRRAWSVGSLVADHAHLLPLFFANVLPGTKKKDRMKKFNTIDYVVR